MVDASDVSVQGLDPSTTRVRFFGPPVVPDASYVVSRPLHPTGESTGLPTYGPMGSLDPHGPPTPSPAERERGSLRVTAEPGSVIVVGGGGEPVGVAFHDANGKQLLGTPPGGGITREQVLDTASGQT